jgi:acylphosphatase
VGKLQRIHLIVHGRVQGVGFRYATQGEAKRLGVHGWVKNLPGSISGGRPDSQVEVLAEGGISETEALAKWCEKGPLFAKVTQVEVRAKSPIETGEFTSFEIRR